MAKYTEMAKGVLTNVGGIENITFVEHCATSIVGADVNELAPMLDPSGVSTATACKVVRELLLAVAK